MTLQAASLDTAGIPEKYRDLYARSADGIWRLNGIEGIRTEEEVRGLETELNRERTELSNLKKIMESVGETPEHFAAFAAEHEQLKAGYSEANEKLASFTEKLRNEMIEKALRRAAAERGIRPEAVSDVLARASSFELKDDEHVVMNKNGEELSPGEWLDQQLKHSTHWLAPSQSAGAKGFAGTFQNHYSAPASLAELVSDSWNKNKRS